MYQEQDPKLNKSWRSAMVMVGIAFSIPGSFAGPILLGYLLDKHFSSSPIFLLVGLLVGSVATIIELNLLIKKMNAMK